MDYRKDVLVYSQDDVQKIWKYYHMTGKSVKEAVEILRRWAEQQRHLPQNQDNDFFERVLARNKFRIEQTKQKIDGYYTLRGLYREFYQKCNDEFVPTREQAILIPMPPLTKSQERIVCMRLEHLDPVTYDPYRIAKYMFLVCEVLWREDYSVGEKFIIDCQGATFDHMKKITLPLLVKAFDIYRGIYSGRLISMDIINAPMIVNILLSLFKIVLPAKIFNRIKVHNDVESLRQSYPKKYLPKDYGGDLKSLDDMKRTWDKVFDDYRRFFDENYYNISDEALRIGDVPKNEIFGIEGTFKTLNLD